jgi:two-component system, sporulation sensor kinase E
MSMRADALAAINSVAVAIGRFASLDEMLGYALDRVLDVVGTEGGCVFLVDEKREELTLVVQRGLPDALVHDIRHIKLGEGLSGRVALTGEPIVIRNLKDDPRLVHQTARDEGLRGFVSMPLRSNFKTYGTLNVHTHADRQFSEQDLQLLASMASQIGLAVANARLFMGLEASERKFRGLVENAEDLIYLTNRAHQIIYANSAFERLLHYDPGALCREKRTILALVHPADREAVARQLAGGVGGHIVRAREFRMVGPDGRRSRWLSQTTVPIRDESGNVTAVQCVAHDVTERREMQEQIATAERLADLGRMAASLAHEIRNPLGAIVNSINALRQPRAVSDHRLFQIITEEARRLDGIINEFLFFARPPRRVPVACNVAELIETAVILFEQSGRLAQNVTLRWNCPPELPDMFADPDQMRQVLWNLISNAVDATSPGGGVIDVDGRLAAEANGIAIAITDEGPGVYNVAEIFEPFFTTKAHGTGLGLVVVGQIVRNHGGRIVVENIEHRGARVTFTIPIATETARRGTGTA